MMVSSGAAMLAVTEAQPRFTWVLFTGVPSTMEVSPDADAPPEPIGPPGTDVPPGVFLAIIALTVGTLD